MSDVRANFNPSTKRPQASGRRDLCLLLRSAEINLKAPALGLCFCLRAGAVRGVPVHTTADQNQENDD